MSSNPVILVTGASGLVGRELCAELARRGWQVRAATRRPMRLLGVTENVIIDDIGPTTDWSAALAGVDSVAHLAARVHVMNDSADNARLYDAVNAQGTRRLASMAVDAGITRFLLVSSIKVSGEERADAYLPQEPPAPRDPYGLSKLEAEFALRESAAGTRMNVAVVRPPLVYGAGVGGNFHRLMRWISRGVPLPFGSIDNRRSLVSTWNLCDMICRWLASPVKNDYPWLVSDGAPMSTPELAQRIARAMGRRAVLVPVPVALMRVAAGVAGRSAEIRRLSDSLTVDGSATRALLDWTPPIDVDVGIARTVEAFRALGS